MTAEEEKRYQERLAKFEADFQRLKANREKIPIEVLITRYNRTYNALCDAVRDEGDWYLRTHVLALTEDYPQIPDEAENLALIEKISGIVRREMGPGGLRDTAQSALVGSLDLQAFYKVCQDLYTRVETEAFLPFFRRYCKPAAGGWTYNSLINCYWRRSDKVPDGAWVRKNEEGGLDLYRFGWPPA